MPSRSPIPAISAIAARATARAAGSPTSSASVAPVSMLNGFSAAAPQSFIHISSRMRGRAGAFMPARTIARDSRSARSERPPPGSPTGIRSRAMWRTTPGSTTSAAG